MRHLQESPGHLHFHEGNDRKKRLILTDMSQLSDTTPSQFSNDIFQAAAANFEEERNQRLLNNNVPPRKAKSTVAPPRYAFCQLLIEREELNNNFLL